MSICSVIGHTDHIQVDRSTIHNSQRPTFFISEATNLFFTEKCANNRVGSILSSLYQALSNIGIANPKEQIILIERPAQLPFWKFSDDNYSEEAKNAKRTMVHDVCIL